MNDTTTASTGPNRPPKSWVPALVANDDAALWRLGPYECEIEAESGIIRPRVTLNTLQAMCRDVQSAFFEDRLSVPWLPFLRFDDIDKARCILLSADTYDGVSVMSEFGPHEDGYFHLHACALGSGGWVWTLLDETGETALTSS